MFVEGAGGDEKLRKADDAHASSQKGFGFTFGRQVTTPTKDICFRCVSVAFRRRIPNWERITCICQGSVTRAFGFDLLLNWC